MIYDLLIVFSSFFMTASLEMVALTTSRIYCLLSPRTGGQTMVLQLLLNVLFDLILYVTSTIFQLYRDGSYWDEPVLI